jgi:hypothetical protein
LPSINEKFTDEFDPIRDMGIGIMSIIKKCFKERKYDIAGLNHRDIFHILLREKEFQLADLFLKYAKDIDIDHDHYHLIRFYGWRQNFDIVEFLVDHGSDLDNAIKTAEGLKEIETTKNLKEFRDKYKNMNIDMKNSSDNYLDEDMGGVSSPMSTLNNVPGMGSAVPPSAKTSNIGSGDKWSNTIGGKPYTQSGSPKRKKKKTLSTKKKKAKYVEEAANTNPYDKVADMMIKRMGPETKSPFKKKKSKINQNAMTQKKFEHHIITLDEFVKQINENK